MKVCDLSKATGHVDLPASPQNANFPNMSSWAMSPFLVHRWWSNNCGCWKLWRIYGFYHRATGFWNWEGSWQGASQIRLWKRISATTHLTRGYPGSTLKTQVRENPFPLSQGSRVGGGFFWHPDIKLECPLLFPPITLSVGPKKVPLVPLPGDKPVKYLKRAFLLVQGEPCSWSQGPAPSWMLPSVPVTFAHHSLDSHY